MRHGGFLSYRLLGQGQDWMREGLGEPEGVRRSTVKLVVLKAFTGFGYGGLMSGGHPPETVVGLVHFLEPGATLLEYLDMARVVDEGFQRVDGGPDAHVDDDERIVVVGDVCGVALGGLEAPKEAGAGFGERVNGVEFGDKAGNAGIVDGSNEAANVDLREGEVVHGQIVANMRGKRELMTVRNRKNCILSHQFEGA